MFIALPDDLECPICEAALKDPQQTVCGHRFCTTCLEPIRNDETSFTCPICRDELEPTQIFPDNAIKRKVMSLKVKCDLHESGCKWEGELRQLDDHRNHCQFVFLPCSLKCGRNAMRRDMASHVKEKCPRRKVKCQHCNQAFECRHMKKHYDKDCPQFPIMCPQGCGKKLVRCQKDDHVAVDGTCPDTSLKCAFEDAGCCFVGKRKDMGQHTKENIETHLTMSHLKVKKLNVKVKEIEDALEKAKERANFHYLWKITEWSVHMQKAKKDRSYEIVSEKVYVSVPGHRVMIKLYPYYDSDDESDDMGIFLYLVKGEYDDFIQWPFRMDYAFSVIDQQQNRRDKTKKIAVDEETSDDISECFHSPGGDGYGFLTFLSHDELQTRSFVKNDCLFVELTVFV